MTEKLTAEEAADLVGYADVRSVDCKEKKGKFSCKIIGGTPDEDDEIVIEGIDHVNPRGISRHDVFVISPKIMTLIFRPSDDNARGRCRVVKKHTASEAKKGKKLFTLECGNDVEI